MKKLLLFFPLIFTVVGVWMLNDNIAALYNGLETVGTVTNIVADHDDDGTSYYPVVTFTSQDGRTHTQKVNQGSSPATYKIGDPIHLLYDKNDLKDVRINTLFWMYIFPAIFISFGLIFIIAFQFAANKNGS